VDDSIHYVHLIIIEHWFALLITCDLNSGHSQEELNGTSDWGGTPVTVKIFVSCGFV
jgi:hypothetical protein